MLFLQASIKPEDLRESPSKNHFRFRLNLLDEIVLFDVAIGGAEPETGVNRPYVSDWEIIGTGEGESSNISFEVANKMRAKHEKEFDALCEAALKVYLRDCKAGGD